MHLPKIPAGELLLRPVKEKDTAALFRLFSNDQVTRYMDIGSFTNISEATQIISFFQEQQQKEEGFRMAITVVGHDELIGTCGFHNWKKIHYKAEIGYDLLPELWGKGIMTTAVAALIKFGFSDMDLNRIEAFVDPVNSPSERLLERLGFSREGLIRDAFFEKGSFVDANIFSLLRADHAREQIW
ncbi:GNAT family N-acetyltransferase [Chitinophaga sp. Cy-1792]|uniref:GNAT family N-acetyltransferase n=1 Tax=Chitinophaga sp. Cy-1792 TaxID=2608339 RepID=UPI00141F7FD1|nr:GNAT family protein [Chitinophaga sp. Cy-1792]NIG54619.1 GNAT family N-acetyltransferase [Chitinophaga sp. Cy-1792]